MNNGIMEVLDFEVPIGTGAPYRGFFVGYTFLKAHSIRFKMTLVSTLSVGAFWRDGLLITLPICHFTVYTLCVIKYA